MALSDCSDGHTRLVTCDRSAGPDRFACVCHTDGAATSRFTFAFPRNRFSTESLTREAAIARCEWPIGR
jgi:hypothetical protein